MDPNRISQVPGVVSANVATNFPTGTPPLRSLRGAIRERLTEALPNTFAPTVLTIVTTTPTAGEARLVGTDQWELGDATIASDILEFDVEKRGSVIRA